MRRLFAVMGLACLLAGGAGVFGEAATEPAATHPAMVDPIHERLARAKGDYDAQTDGARKRLVAYFQARADGAQKRGDLEGLKSFEGMREAFEKEGTLPENSPELALRDNVNTYESAVRLATKMLGNAYGAAVRDYTKAGLIDQAEVVQGESDAFEKGGTVAAGGGAAPVAGAGPAAGAGAGVAVGNGRWFVFNAKSGLPKYFEGNTDVLLSDEGLTFGSVGVLRTAKTDFISCDFAFDAVVEVKNPEMLKVGMGQGAMGPGAHTGFCGIEMNGTTAVAQAVGLLGKVPRGTHLFHVEKRGTEFTSAIALNYSGKGSADYSRANDIGHWKYLTGENTRVFLSAAGPNVVVKEVRLTVP